MFRGAVLDPSPGPATGTLGPVNGSGGRATRQLRAAVATLVVVGLGGSAHAMGGGSALRPVPAVVLLLLVGPLVWLVVRSRTSLPRMVLAVGAGQLVTHLALMAMAPSQGGSAVTAHVHGALAATGNGPSLPTALHLTGSMLAAHLVATVLASLLLTLGEDVVRAVVARLVAVLAAAPVLVTLRTVPAVAPVRRVAGRTVRPVGGRAPPLPAC